jgi:hypothetical protein
VDAGDQIAAAHDAHCSPREPHLEARVLREEHLVPGVDARRVGAGSRDDPVRQPASLLAGMISPARVSVSSSAGSITT